MFRPCPPSAIRRTKNKKNILRKYTSHGVRPDSRAFHAVRRTTVVKSVITKNAAGSALVRLGDTQVIAAATLRYVVLTADDFPKVVNNHNGNSADYLDVTVSMDPLCSRSIAPSGRLSTQREDGGLSASSGGGGGSILGGAERDSESIESFVRRIVRSCNIVNMKDLIVEQKQTSTDSKSSSTDLVWKIIISVVVLNDDGCVADASLMACIAALSNVQLPAISVQDNDNSNQGMPLVRITESSDESKTTTKKKLKLQTIPVPLTVAMFDGFLLADPTANEAHLCEGSVSVVAMSTGEILSANKLGGKVSIQPKQLVPCVRMAIGRAKEMEEILRL